MGSEDNYSAKRHERSTPRPTGIIYRISAPFTFQEAETDDLGPLPTITNHRVSTVGDGEVRTRKISIGFDPTEAIPTVVNYDQLHTTRVRPTIEELISGEVKPEEAESAPVAAKKRGQLGWIRGVFLWSILNLWGVMLFLRIAWMNAQAGMGLFLVIVLIGSTIAILTSLSTSAISTNGEIGSGGTYYMISRSLGPEFGTAIGIIFTLANTVNVSLNLQGFAETVANLLGENGLYMVDRANDMRIIGVIALIALTLFTFCGMELASKLQSVFFVILLAAILNIFIGCWIPPNDAERARGFVGPSSQLFADNFKPAFQKNETFMSVFGVFFPSVTGILAGTSITGDLRDPSGAIPKGTIYAIIFTSISYIFVGWPTVAVTLRHASGNISDLIYLNHSSPHFPCEASATCTEGNIDNYDIMQVVAHFRWIIVCGIFAATLSTSLGCIVFAPKIFQAVCRDKILPGFKFFAKGYGRNDEPYRAYALGTVIAVAFLMPSDLNFISAIVSNFFLLTYALVNYATFNASFSRQPGWRPTFKYYNLWLSLATGIACLVIMFLIHWISAILSIALIVIVWICVYYLKPAANWGTSLEAGIFRNALVDALKLLHVQEHIKNYRPQILALTGLPPVRPALVYFANSICHSTGLLICGHVLIDESPQQRRTVQQETYKWLRRTHVKSFYDSIVAASFADGAKALIQTSGLGKMKPNILFMGYYRQWATKYAEGLTEEYVSVIRSAFENRLAVMILCAKEGFGISEAVNFDQLVLQNALTRVATEDNVLDRSGKAAERTIDNVTVEVKDVKNPEMLARIELSKRFEAGKKKIILGEIHVWWLYDDGGLGLLLPYLLTQSSPWRGCKLKVFCLPAKPKEDASEAPTEEQIKSNMRALLDKFRIEALDVVPVDLDIAPSAANMQWFQKIIEENTRERRKSVHSIIHDRRDPLNKHFSMVDLKEKTKRHIRLRDLLLEHSAKSALNVVTLPLPKKDQTAPLYMATLETLTADLPPTLLVRGTQENVLTYYC
ncbi:solute carrier family 12 member 2-like isoform X2 [Paramacrobiotus metropolitanus]|uniref:solute carrier family 12 member 2-like isoform X2 n=1 Tax=Paramacrobiotus metropolitanus TaxID=2943436 RepID=UPI002445DA94|nr:solute carrier family 12 member 2-like isoform X2 [Paramacrobiotus metropolitanus]